jgi:hypothetical protein
VGGIHAEEGEGGGPVLRWMAGDATEPGRGGRRETGEGAGLTGGVPMRVGPSHTGKGAGDSWSLGYSAGGS